MPELLPPGLSLGGGITVGSLVAHVVADTSGLPTGLAKATNILTAYSTKIDGFMVRNATAIRRVGIQTTLMGTAVVGGIGAMVRSYGEFEKRMRRATAVSDFTAKQFIEMSNMAEKASIKYNIAATQAADAFYNLGQAGLTVEEQIAAFPATLAFAKAGVLDVSFAAETLVDVMKGTHASFNDAIETVDILTKASIASNASLAQLGESLQIVASIAYDSHTPLYEVAAAFGLMANAGVKGTNAGTALRRALVNLSDPSSEIREVLRQLDVHVFDVTGRMRNFADILVDVRGALDSVTDQQKKHAVATIFGVRAITGIEAMLSHTVDEYRDYNKQMKESAGVTQEVVDKQMAAFSEKMGQLWKQTTVLVRHIGKSLVPAITSLGDHLGKLVEKITAWVDANGELVTALSLTVAGIGVFTLTSGLALSVLGNLSLVCASAGWSFTALAGTLSIATLGIGALAAAIIYIVPRIINMRKEIARLSKELVMTEPMERIDSYIKKLNEMVTTAGPLNQLLGKLSSVSDGLKYLREQAIRVAAASRDELISMYKEFDLEMPDVLGTGIAKATSVLRESLLKQIEYSRDAIIKLGEDGIKEFNTFVKGEGDSTLKAVKDTADLMSDVPLSLVRTLEALDEELRTLGMITEEQERQARITEFRIQLEDEFGMEKDRTNRQQEQANMLMDEYMKKLEKVKEGSRGFPALAKEIGQWASDATNLWARLGEVITNTLDSAADKLTDVLMRTKVDWKEFARQVVIDLTKMLIKAQMATAASDLGSLFSGMFRKSNLSITGPTNAGVPPVLQKGGIIRRPQMVLAGETPEAFVPLSGGRSIPVEMRGSSGGNLDIRIHNEGLEKLTISRAESYMTSDQRIIDVTVAAAGKSGPYRRSVRSIRKR